MLSASLNKAFLLLLPLSMIIMISNDDSDGNDVDNDDVCVYV